MHADSGNSGIADYPAALGNNLTMLSVVETLPIILWGSDGSMTAGYANTSITPVTRGLAAIDPSTFQILATWYPPGNETLGLGYMEYLMYTDEVVVSTKEGHLYVVYRGSCDGIPTFAVRRAIDLTNDIKPGGKRHCDQRHISIHGLSAFWCGRRG